jgi:cell division protein FtsA
MSAEAKRKSKDKIIKLENKKSVKTTAKADLNPDDVIFSLDIGTRTVVGILGVQEKDKFKVIAAEVVEHKSRAMIDGQIHDVQQVAAVALEVKNLLEKKTGIKLTKVAIAAAGRVLKTCEVHVERQIEAGKEIDQELVGSLEIEAIQKAQIKLDEDLSKSEPTQFYCVGYSVINYYLNGYIISKLIGHKGKRIGADVLATFLPVVVVESLYTVMEKVGLEVINLTLEPIAAINVTIPKDLRLLNLALVDIGAGTSDIAITRDGSVVAYAMVPVAGDEITEMIAQQYLVDFNTAEKIKISLTSQDQTISFTDILNRKQEIKKEELYDVIKPAVEVLATTISEKILEYNHKSPNAVFLIGGGSQVPGLTQLIAKCLKLPADRVAVRSRDVVQNIKFKSKKLSGPEAITPLGIAITAQLQVGKDFLYVTVNGQKVRLFNSKKLTVADALILIGFNPEQLIGRTGKSLTYIVNGVKRTIRGNYGKAAEIFVNQKLPNLEEILNVGDDIEISPAENGKAASVMLKDIVNIKKSGYVLLNGQKIEIGSLVFVNGKPAGADKNIQDGDEIQVVEIATLNDLLKHCEINADDFIICVNGQQVDKGYVLADSDVVSCEIKSNIAETEKNEVVQNTLSSVEHSTQKEIISEVQKKAPGIDITVNGKPVTLSGNKANYIFVDIFNFINFDLSNPQGSIVLRLNGKPAAFTDEVRFGDVVDILWDGQA